MFYASCQKVVFDMFRTCCWLITFTDLRLHFRCRIEGCRFPHDSCACCSPHSCRDGVFRPCLMTYVARELSEWHVDIVMCRQKMLSAPHTVFGRYRFCAVAHIEKIHAIFSDAKRLPLCSSILPRCARRFFFAHAPHFSAAGLS